jgi:hypothetical protein
MRFQNVLIYIMLIICALATTFIMSYLAENQDPAKLCRPARLSDSDLADHIVQKSTDVHL